MRKQSLFNRLWGGLRRPATRVPFVVVLVVGGLGGVVAWGGFNTFMEHTNTLGFCIGCHEMRDNVYVEYQATVHWKNASGVRVVCSDCHVPRDWTAKLMRKIQATNELFHHFAGSIDTPEKFEANRLAMAERVWAAMAASNSRECRNCHSYEAMDFHKQSARARDKMGDAQARGETCIECHKGIAHKLPIKPRDD